MNLFANAWLTGLLLSCLLVLAGCNSGVEEDMPAPNAVAHIEGSVFYRERMMLPPEALIEVQFQDISKADAMASVLATVQLAAQDGPPYGFSIAYDPGRIDKRMRYALRASISIGGSLMFTSTDYIDPFSGKPLEILVRRVAEPLNPTLNPRLLLLWIAMVSPSQRPAIRQLALFALLWQFLQFLNR